MTCDGKYCFKDYVKYDVMTQKQAIQLFEEKRVRTAWDTDAEKWRNLNWLQVVTS